MFNPVGGYQELARSLAGDTEFTAKIVGGSSTLSAESRLETAWFIVNTGMNDSAVVP